MRLTMNIVFLLKSYLLGLSAASGVGPIFVLTSHRGALQGFLRGFFTAVGAAVGDGALFFMGLLGLLSILEGSPRAIFFMHLIGGVLLIGFGISTLRRSPKFVKEKVASHDNLFLTAMKSFILTMLNPLAVFFFIFGSVHILPPGQSTLPLNQIISATIAVGCGSLSALTIVAFLASRFGSAMSYQRLSKISMITGILFIGLGFYFLTDLGVMMYHAIVRLICTR